MTYNQNWEWEKRCSEIGVMRYRNRVEKLKEKGKEWSTLPVTHAIGDFVCPLSKGIVQYILRARTSPGRCAASVPWLEQMDPDVCALLTLRVLLNSLSSRPTMQQCCKSLARLLTVEYNLQQFAKSDPESWTRMQTWIKANPWAVGPSEAESLRRYAMKAAGWQQVRVSDEISLQAAMLLIMLAIEHTGVVVRHRELRTGQRHTVTTLVPTPELIAWVEASHLIYERWMVVRPPMLCPPKEWTNTTDGGYYTRECHTSLFRPARRFVRGTAPRYTAAKHPLLFRVVNFLQSVPWAVNEPVADVFARLWSTGADIPGHCVRQDLPEPAVDPSLEGEAKTLAAKAKREAQNWNYRQRSRRISASRVFDLMTNLRGKPFWCPSYIDFRTRVYPRSQFLSPHQGDLSRGLMRFNRGVRIGERGIYWLAVRAANTYGYDKATLDERVKWAEENSEEMVRAAKDPMNSDWWLHADEPMQHLATCLEWAGVQEQGEDFVTHLPIAQDGTCNGLQILAAVSLDETVGRMVNLVPSDRPQDIYGFVAESLIARCKEAAAHDEDAVVREIAEQWLEFGIDRKTVKRPVMIVPYNGTYYGIQGYIVQEIYDACGQIDPATGRLRKHPFGNRMGRAVRLLARWMLDAMKVSLRGPKQTQAWLASLARRVATDKVPLKWMTPSGVPIHQAYAECQIRQVSCYSGFSVGVRTQWEHSFASNTDLMRPGKQVQAFSPNWIHSLDASVLHATFARMQDEGIADCVAVHDSFGCLAPHVDQMNRILREEFVRIFSTDQRVALMESMSEMTGVPIEDMPPPPERGSLDISKVLDSPYFFS